MAAYTGAWQAVLVTHAAVGCCRSTPEVNAGPTGWRACHCRWHNNRDWSRQRSGVRSAVGTAAKHSQRAVRSDFTFQGGPTRGGRQSGSRGASAGLGNFKHWGGGSDPPPGIDSRARRGGAAQQRRQHSARASCAAAAADRAVNLLRITRTRNLLPDKIEIISESNGARTHHATTDQYWYEYQCILVLYIDTRR